MLARVKIVITGLVQGVGFRPYIYRLANQRQLSGFVQNTGAGVVAEMQGDIQLLADIGDSIRRHAPEAARIDRVFAQAMPAVVNEQGFHIVTSAAQAISTIVPFDCAICENCLQDFYNPQSRHFMNFFISCTDCGPRYSMLRFLPYDRPATTMGDFPMCVACSAEYGCPDDRRFHAQSTTCPACGPHYTVFSYREGRELEFSGDKAVMDFAARELRQGRIVALQGIGGYHLLCDPFQADAVKRIKDGKRREGKPLAIVAKDVRYVETLCELTGEEKKWLLSRNSPIVLARLKRHNPFAGANDGLHTLGVMLPYTAALHYLLTSTGYDCLVATSANLSGQPTIVDVCEAKAGLSGLADYVVSHNREIYRRADDTVAFLSDGPVVIRPGRGLAPLTLPQSSFPHRIMAVGAEQKVTVSLLADKAIIMSEFMGDLQTAEYRQAYEEAVTKMLELYTFVPDIVVHDLNPDYYSTRFAKELAARFQASAVGVQHHEAHVLSVMMEHGCQSAIGFAFDGTGYGWDGTVWGGEGFIVEPGQDIRRAFHLESFLLAGGTKSIQEPARLLYYFLQEIDPGLNHMLFPDHERLAAICRAARVMETPLTSSMGRLFDITAVLLGCGTVNRYDAMLPMHLESLADRTETGYYPVSVSKGGTHTVSPFAIMAAVAADVRQHTAYPVIAARFHNTIARIVREAADSIRAQSGVDTVALAGGVFQNRLLLEKSRTLLRESGFQVIHGHLVPMNDSGISVGQIGGALLLRSKQLY